jgi:hypothetical protein
LVETLFQPGFPGFQQIKNKLSAIMKGSGSNMITFSNSTMEKILPGFYLKMKVGPVLTIKKLSGIELNLHLGKNWSPSLGDLELF